MRDIAFSVIWLTLIPATLLSPCMGVLTWAWTALLSPNELLYGFMSGVQMNRIIAVTTIGVILFNKEKKQAYLDPILVLLLLLAITGTVSWMTSIMDTDNGDAYYQKLLKEIALAFAVTVAISTPHRIWLLVLTCCLGFGLVGTKEGLIFLLTAGGHKVEGLQSVGDNNALATALLMLAPLLYYGSRHAAVRAVRLGLLAGMGLCLVTVVATYSRGGFVGLLVLGAFMVKNSRNKLGSLALVAVAGALIYSAAPESWFQRLNTINDAGTDGSFLGRVIAWKISWLIAVDHPFFGGGFHAVQRFPIWEAYRPGLRQLEWIPTPGDDSFPLAAHSIYFEVLGDMGFIGLFLFLSILLVAFWQCRSIARMARSYPSLAWAADLGRMMQISLVVYVVTAALLSMAYFEFFYVLLALISRVRRTVQQAIVAEARDGKAVARAAFGLPAPVRQPAFTRQAAGSASQG